MENLSLCSKNLVFDLGRRFHNLLSGLYTTVCGEMAKPKEKRALTPCKNCQETTGILGSGGSIFCRMEKLKNSAILHMAVPSVTSDDEGKLPLLVDEGDKDEWKL